MPASSSSRWLVIAVVVIVGVAASLSFAPTRELVYRMLGSLRMQKAQAVNVNFSNFVGPDANQGLQQMVSQMISDKVNVTVNENEQPASTAEEASQLAGFHVQVISQRKDALQLAVGGRHELNLTVDRSRLQAILTQAGHSDVVLPQSIDGAQVSVQIARTVQEKYGNCPHPSSAAANVATPPPVSTQFSDCVIVNQGPSPVVNIPPGLDVAQLAEVGLEVGGMSPSQARDFLQRVDWKSAMGLSVPQSMRSYETVQVKGVQGTLLNLAGRQGATYALIWAKDGMVNSLTGYGSSGDAVGLADSLQ